MRTFRMAFKKMHNIEYSTLIRLAISQIIMEKCECPEKVMKGKVRLMLFRLKKKKKEKKEA